MAELDLDALEQAARDAGGGCWFSTGWTVGSRGFEVGDLKSRDRICSDATERCAEFIAAANPATILELLGRLEAAEKSDAESLAMYHKARDERDALRAALQHEADCVEAAKAEIEALRAKIEAMERQEPVAWQTRTRSTWNDGTWGQWRKCSEEYAQDIKKTPLLHDWLYEARALYALPGAKGYEK